MAEHPRWIVTTTQERPIGDVARDLADCGFAISETLDSIGCITGSAERGLIAALSKIEGVADIAPDTQIQLPPTDQGTTW
jgi:hypothetical protein